MASVLKVREPDFDFRPDEIIWPEAPEVSVIFNAMSTCTPVVEQFLNKVMMQCRRQVGADRAHLRDEIDDFVRQESNHYRTHQKYNAMVEAAGLRLDQRLEDDLQAEYREMLKTRSLPFLVAYCAGFENFTLFISRFLFEQAGDLFREGDSIGDLWRWHFAEEYEHRSVCHDGFAAISGNYFQRTYGLIYSAFHLNRHVSRRIASYLEQYRQDMTPEERKRSVRREKAFMRKFNGWTLPRMARIFIPYYDPGKARPSPGMEKALARYAAMSPA